MVSEGELFSTLPALTLSQAQHIIERECNGYALEVAHAVLKVASELGEFTPEDVRAWCEPERGGENTFSSAILKVVTLGLIKPVRMTRAKRACAHGRKIVIYRRTFEL